jgi:hypothetical protein
MPCQHAMPGRQTMPPCHATSGRPRLLTAPAVPGAPVGARERLPVGQGRLRRVRDRGRQTPLEQVRGFIIMASAH